MLDLFDFEDTARHLKHVIDDHTAGDIATVEDTTAVLDGRATTATLVRSFIWIDVNLKQTVNFFDLTCGIDN